MENLPQPVEYSNQRILTSAQLAELYETDLNHIKQNYNANKERYVLGKHYYALEGKEKREFLNRLEIPTGSKNAKVLYLWTEKGALLHAKSLGTDAAWNMYERLVDDYYRLRESQSQTAHHIFPNTLWAERSRLFAERTKIPADMFCVFEETTTTFHFADLRNCGLPEGSLPDGSIGRRWCEYVRSHPEKYDTSLMQHYPHSYPDKRKDQWAFIYPIEWLPDFRKWFKEVYIPVHLPEYLKYLKVQQEDIQRIMLGFGVPYQIKERRNSK